MFDIPLNQKKRQILHVDADAFFASVEQILDPKLRGKPVIVGGPSDTSGIVSACSYEAKRFGIHSGMAMYMVKQKCPQAVVVPGHFSAYRKFSERMYEIFLKYTPAVEMASIDEAYLDITGFEDAYKKSSYEIAKSLLMEIYRELGLSVSCGLSCNKTVSKVASSLNKPHKLTEISFGNERKFLSEISLKDMPGVGPKTFSNLERFGFKKISDVADLSVDEVVKKFGVSGIPLWKKCRGVDNSVVISVGRLPKSISKENTFYPSEINNEKCLAIMKELTSQVLEKLRSYDMKAKTISVRIKYKVPGKDGRHNFKSFIFQSPMGFYSSCDSEIFPAVRTLFKKHVNEDYPIRLVGVGVNNLMRNYNLNLFSSTQKSDGLFKTIDTMRQLYGKSTIRFGA